MKSYTCIHFKQEKCLNIVETIIHTLCLLNVKLENSRKFVIQNKLPLL